MKHSIWKKTLSILLAGVLMVSMLSIAASAAEKTESGKTYASYTSLGDSIAAGFMLPDYQDKQENGQHIVSKSRVEGAYPTLVSDAVGSENTHYLAQPGLRTVDLHMLLDDDYDGDFVTQNSLGRLTQQVAGVKEEVDYSTDTMKAQRKQYQEAIKESDLITVDIGMNDTMITALGLASSIVGLDGMEAPKEGEKPDFSSMIQDQVSLEKFVSNGEKALQTIANSSELKEKFTYSLHYMLKDWQKDYKAIIDKIFELNPDATVVAVGNYNTMKHFGAVSYLTKWYYDGINDYKKNLADSYGDKLVYAAVPDATLNCNSLKSIVDAKTIDFHPNTEGHKYMAEQILSVL